MSVDPAAVPPEQEDPRRVASVRPDAAHLDEDPEALEDPVHSGDAAHQHERHTHPRPQPEAD
jgi:hypothetical protein